MGNKTNMSNFKTQTIFIVIAVILLVSSVKANTIKTIRLEAVSCELYAEFCLPVSAKELTNYQLLDNGSAWDGDFAPCGLERVGNKLVANAVALRLEVGTHRLELVGTENQSFLVEVTCETTRQKNCKDVIDGTNAINTADNSLEIEIAPSDLLHYDILVDGQSYDGAIAPAQVKAKDAFNVADLFGETFFVETFKVNGKSFQGAFNAPKALVQKMNEWDEKGNWSLNAKGILVGGHSSQVYSDMTIAVKSTGERYLYERFTLNVAGASSIKVANNALVEVKHFATGCSDSISLDGHGSVRSGTASK